ncbi:hypothetical protein L2X99_08545 [Microbacterium sp. KUDC0406]|uniref:hypothetical protein n=1 Tax=Microbacterium sp. KUDC0406 TaxID=2909588 RepID=UPI001F196161|nr:hypothetical protein [Microbacterium sp. KUDC0406]UJP11521.1 hypothetical protein L2X99_08545 [Microbacterium sp. KUDC0406]
MKLNREQRDFLALGLGQWGGPARINDLVARVIGYDDAGAFCADHDRLRGALRSEEPLDARDTLRALIAVELVFVDDLFGAGVDWETVTGLSDAETAAMLRAIQRARLH